MKLENQQEFILLEHHTIYNLVCTCNNSNVVKNEHALTFRSNHDMTLI